MVFNAKDDLLDIKNYLYDTSGNRPAAGTEGRLFVQTDTGETFYDNGSSWIAIGIGESNISLSNLASKEYASLTNRGHGNEDHTSTFATLSDPVTDFDGSTGVSGQFLQTDGTNLSFADPFEQISYETGHTQWGTSLSGSEIYRITPANVTGANEYTGFDGFESGSSQIGFGEISDGSINSSSEVYGVHSYQINAQGEAASTTLGFLEESITTDGKRLQASVKIDNQTGNSNDEVEIIDPETLEIKFLGNGDITHNGVVVDTWNADTIYNIEVVVDLTNNESDLVVNGITVDSNRSFLQNASSIDSFSPFVDTSASGSTVNAFFDRLTYTASVEDTVNAGDEFELTELFFIDTVEFREKGERPFNPFENKNVYVEVKREDDAGATTVARQNLGGATKASDLSQTGIGGGEAVTVNITNGAGEVIEGNVRLVGHIEN